MNISLKIVYCFMLLCMEVAVSFIFPPNFGCTDKWYASMRNSSCECGRRQNSDSRIIGGQSTKIEKYPWMAQVIYRNFVICGGTVISDRYILSAAHCLDFLDSASDISLGLGAEKRDGPRISYAVESFIIHPKYNGATDGYDIGLIKTESIITYSDKVQPICLPCQEMSYNFLQFGHLTGWGVTDLKSTFPGELQHTINIPMNSYLCKITVLVQLSRIIPEGTICGRGTTDTCQGDSGGPFSMSVNGKNTQIGITSFGISCGKPWLPGVYTDVSRYIDWIMEHTSDSTYCS